MTKRKIIIEPDPILRKSDPLKKSIVMLENC